MGVTNLGRVQGGSIFYSTATSGTSINKSTLTPTNIVPLLGDSVLFQNGDMRKITAINSTTVTCGSVLTSLKGVKGDTGEKGEKGESAALYTSTGQNTDGAMTQKAVTDALGDKANASDIVNPYPIGSIYMSMNNKSPASSFGGRWEPLPEGFVLQTLNELTSITNENINDESVEPNATGASKARKVLSGLPNITGHFGQTVYAVSNNTSGAFTQVSGGYASIPNGSWAQLMDMNFDASRSSDRYGKSSIVQPQVIKVYMWRRTE